MILKIVLMAVSLIVMLGINSLANILPINGVYTADISDKFMNYFTPAGYVFSIWALIYIALLVHLVYVVIKRKVLGEYINKIFPWYIVLNVSNALWMFAWHYEYLWATIVLMVVLLASLIKIYLIGQKEKKKTLLLTSPVSLYLGWISVATVANISVLLTSLGAIQDYQLSIAMLVILVVGVLGLLFTIKNNDYIYPSVFIWALIGILVRFNWVAGIVLAVVASLLLIISGILYMATISASEK